MSDGLMCLGLYQPWATLVALGLKQVETRSWRTTYRGLLGIYAAKTELSWDQLLIDHPVIAETLRERSLDIRQLPRGKVIAVAELTDCWQFAKADDPWEGRPHGLLERHFGVYDLGRYGLALSNVVALPNPVQTRGYQRFWRTSQVEKQAIFNQLPV